MPRRYPTRIKKINCPVCGYNQLKRPPSDDLICPCCGVHFGLDDCSLNYDALRKIWLKNGAKWWSDATSPPQNWEPILQLQKAGLSYSLNNLSQKQNVYTTLGYNKGGSKFRRRYNERERLYACAKINHNGDIVFCDNMLLATKSWEEWSFNKVCISANPEDFYKIINAVPGAFIIRINSKKCPFVIDKHENWNRYTITLKGK